jgi:hypothetical protein
MVERARGMGSRMNGELRQGGITGKDIVWPDLPYRKAGGSAKARLQAAD